MERWVDSIRRADLAEILHPRRSSIARSRLAAFVPLLLLVVTAAVSVDETQAGDRYALVIGVHQYDRNQLRSLPYAESDAVAVAGKLKDLGFRRVVLMTQTLGAKESRFLPTARNVRETLEGFLNPKVWSEDDTAVVVLSGHGVQFKNEAVSYFCPMDAELEKKETLIPIDSIYKQLEKCPAGFKLLIADCCRNDPQSDFSRARKEVDLESVTRPQRIKPPGGVAAFFSCSEGEKAFESPTLKKAIFTHFLLQGLSDPKSDLDRDGKVDLDELVRFTKRNVTDYVRDEFGEKTIQVPELVGKTRGLVPITEFSKQAGGTTDPSPAGAADAPAKPATPAAIASAFDKLLAVKGANNETIRIGLWFCGPLTDDDLQQAAILAEAMRKQSVVVAGVVADDDSLRTLADDAIKRAQSTIRTKQDGRTILEDASIDAIAFWGRLKTTAVTDWESDILSKGGSVKPDQLAALEYVAEMTCQAGKDFYVVASPSDRFTWSPSNKLLDTVRKNGRVAWRGTKKENDFEGFFTSVRSRSQGAGDILKPK